MFCIISFKFYCYFFWYPIFCYPHFKFRNSFVFIYFKTRLISLSSPIMFICFTFPCIMFFYVFPLYHVLSLTCFISSSLACSLFHVSYAFPLYHVLWFNVLCVSSLSCSLFYVFYVFPSSLSCSLFHMFYVCPLYHVLCFTCFMCSLALYHVLCFTCFTSPLNLSCSLFSIFYLSLFIMFFVSPVAGVSQCLFCFWFALSSLIFVTKSFSNSIDTSALISHPTYGKYPRGPRSFRGKLPILGELFSNILFY